MTYRNAHKLRPAWQFGSSTDWFILLLNQSLKFINFKIRKFHPLCSFAKVRLPFFSCISNLPQNQDWLVFLIRAPSSRRTAWIKSTPPSNPCLIFGTWTVQNRSGRTIPGKSWHSIEGYPGRWSFNLVEVFMFGDSWMIFRCWFRNLKIPLMVTTVEFPFNNVIFPLHSLDRDGKISA